MNLMDMLSADLALSSVQDTDPFYESLRPEEQVPSGPPPNTIHYLPCMMSPLQRDMAEAVVQIFACLLESETIMRKQRTSINTLLESSVLLESNQQAIVNSLLLMYNQLVTISMHPSLVVDHFISKGLLLLSPKDRLLDLSGKMRLFNELIDVLSEKQDSGALVENYNLLVVARSVKELELIEGLIVGKKLQYYNASSKKLYEELPHKSRRETPADDSPGADQWRRLRHHRRLSLKSTTEPKLVLHLITSSQLYNTFSFNGTLDLIFSFEAELDFASPAVEVVRRNNKATLGLMPSSQRETPVLVPIQVFSIEHIGRLLAKSNERLGSSSNDHTHRLRVLKTFIVNRSHLFIPNRKEDFVPNYGKLFRDIGTWLLQWPQMPLPASLNSLEKYSDKIVFDLDDAKVISSLKENHLTALSAIFMPMSGEKQSPFTNRKSEHIEPIDYLVLKRELALFFNERAEEVEALIDDGLSSILPDLRKVEASRQSEIDSFEDQVGENYRKLRKLNDTLTSVDKKYNRVESESQNLQAQFTECEKLLAHLDDITTNKEDEEVEKLTQEQSHLVQELEEEKKRLEKEYNVLSDESERFREQYQTMSTEAVKFTGKVSVATGKQAALEYKLNGPGMRRLPSLAREDELAVYDSKLKRILEENRFLGLLFQMRFDRLVKERTSSMELAATLSLGRLNNRGSRATTPFLLN